MNPWLLVGSLLSQAPPLSQVPQPWGQYGVLGALAFILLWFSWSSIQRERLRADNAEAARKEAEQALRDLYEKVLPVMTQATGAMSKLADITPDIVSALRSVSRDNRS